MTRTRTTSKTKTKTKRPKRPTKLESVEERDRESVLADFRKIAGPLRGRNRDEKPKP